MWAYTIWDTDMCEQLYLHSVWVYVYTVMYMNTYIRNIDIKVYGYIYA